MQPAFTWENYRRSDGTLDMCGALRDRMPINSKYIARSKAFDFLLEVETFCEIRNPEAAAIALAAAMRLVRGE